eukprot:3078048-Rhodomonas_salina.1
MCSRWLHAQHSCRPMNASPLARIRVTCAPHPHFLSFPSSRQKKKEKKKKEKKKQRKGERRGSGGTLMGLRRAQARRRRYHRASTQKPLPHRRQRLSAGHDVEERAEVRGARPRADA